MGIELEVRKGESVAEAAWRLGYIWPTLCWGQADCVVCFTKIVGGEVCAQPMEEVESDAIRFKMPPRLRTDRTVRLACQLKVTGDDLVVEKRGVRLVEQEDNNMISEADESVDESERERS
ncbi:2Fe-2S iron-sulfur cluster-binding protein [Microbacterium sp.]|uniref:2Fe-2S iron-sulfur cluster-binding protein n=1 Tax=Microbacterium sp. TaxID=51671 RepID=UPI0027372944|nr:2Fe-2S iron-sulfur cluster-binding protein [Microbacterium sp.]MDP3950419.1 2Fe-2S iron-sulfur cluster-binding protein [Microbacterium sp.]